MAFQNECTIMHQETINQVREVMPSEKDLSRLADVFKVFSDKTRVSILTALSEAELCVCDIAALLDMSVSAISHQLRVLKQSGLVKSRKDGKSVFYSLDDDHVKTILMNGFEHSQEKR